MHQVGIITIQSDNFGNRLQNYAVQTVLEKQGFSAWTFPREYYYNKKHKKKILIATLLAPTYIGLKLGMFSKSICKKIAGASHIYKMNQFTKDFIKISNVYGERISASEVDEYDYFLAGSDQLWNPKFPMVTGVDFLAFSRKEKNISFSASLGVEELSEDVKEKYKAYLKSFKAVSVREKKAQELLQPLTDVNVHVHIDPTMMLTADEWEKIEHKVNVPSKYIVVYLLDYSSRADVIAALKKSYQEDLPEIIWILDKENPKSYWYGPQEFLYVIHHADAVFTDSFHGSVFSILFHRSLCIFLRRHKGYSMNSRITTLIEKMGISEDVVCNDINKYTAFTNIDYELVEKKLSMERRKVDDYLKGCLIV